MLLVGIDRVVLRVGWNSARDCDSVVKYLFGAADARQSTKEEASERGE
jgi:hypothetical protein